MSLESVLESVRVRLSRKPTGLTSSLKTSRTLRSRRGTPEGAYKGQYPVFRSVLSEAGDSNGDGRQRIDGTVEDQRPARSSYEPGNPIADEDGFVYMSNVNSVQEMASMMAASRSYQTNIEVMNTAKDLLMRTLTIGQQ